MKSKKRIAKRKRTARGLTLAQSIQRRIDKRVKEITGSSTGRLKIPQVTDEPKIFIEPYVLVAEQFARHLVEGNFNAARNMLSPSLKRKVSASELKKELASMSAYAKSPATRIYNGQPMDYWPERKINDLGCVYVGIGGDGFVEAVTVVIAKESSKLLIREILDWGRP